MSGGDVIVSVRGIKLRLGDYQVLGGVDFDVRDRVRPGCTTGQVVGILGPSGVGKTRLLRVLAGLDSPDAGTVEGHGVGCRLGEVGLVLQSHPLLRHRTVRGNLELAGRLGGLSKKQAADRAQDLMSRFHIEGCAASYPCQISGGERQRASIAQQVMCPRRLILLDEPFANLDPGALDVALHLLGEVANLHELNTLVLVTHDVRAALLASDTLMLLGRDRDAMGGIVPGARVQASYDLVDRGLAWHPELSETQAFADLEREVRARFKEL